MLHQDVALVHDYLLVMRGAERTFATLCDIWPQAPVYTLLYDQQGTKGRFDSHPVQTSALQATGVTQGSFRKLLPLFPAAASTMYVDRPVVISSSSAFAHGVKTPPEAVHICYCHSPFRYAWFERERATSEVPAALRPALRGALAGIRRWDVKAASRVSHYIANSRHTQRRIKAFYGRDAAVVYPPVEVGRFRSGEPEDYFLIVSEIVPHKRVEQAVVAAVEAGQRLKVVGSGPDLDRLRALYSPQVEFVGRADDATLETLYAGAKAVIVPNIEEFGIVAVEAQAAGRPVIAARGGGATETVRDGVTGRFFTAHEVGELTQILRTFDSRDFDSEVIVEHAQKFSPEAFQRKMLDIVSDLRTPQPLSSAA